MDPEYDAQEVARLVAMSPLQRDREISGAAGRLGVSVKVLKAEIKDREGESTNRRRQGSAIEFPERPVWGAPVDGAVVLDETVELLNKYVVLPEYAAETLALFVVHTYLVDHFLWTPKIGLISPEKRCGKSRVFDCIRLLVHRPLYTEGVTPASLFRLIDMYQPTVLMDEMDTYIKQDETLRGLMNSSSKKGGSVVRCVGDDFEPRQFRTFAPLVYGMIGYPWSTVADRSVLIKMKRKAKFDQVARFNERQAEASFGPLSQRIARLAQDLRGTIEGLLPEIPDSLDDRAGDIWEPLLAVSDGVGGRWPKVARAASVALSGSRDSDTTSMGVLLLSDIRLIFRSNAIERITSNDLCERLNSLMESPWRYCNRDRPIDPNKLSQFLRPFEVAPKSIRLGGQTPKGYYLTDFDDVFNRYLPADHATPQQQDSPNFGEQSCTSADVASGLIASETVSTERSSHMARHELERTSENVPCGNVAPLREGRTKHVL